MDLDIRWIQRFSNYSKAYKELKSAVELSKQRELSKLEKQGVIQCFEYTYELAWKTLKDLLVNQGVAEILGARDTFREAFKLNLIENGDVWMEMIKSRNLTSHIYDEKVVEEITNKIFDAYFQAFDDLYSKLNELKETKGS